MRRHSLMRFSLLLFPFAVFLFGCAEKLVQSESVDPALSAKPVSRISYDETSITLLYASASSNIVGELTKASGSQAGRLKDFSKTRRVVSLDADGSRNIEVTYLEGDEEIRIPMKLYNEIKGKMHPRHPQANPVKRYTIQKNVYTAYGIDGSVVFTKTFPELAKSRGIGDAVPAKQAADRMNALLSSLETRKIPYKMVGFKDLQIERPVATGGKVIKEKITFDAQTGLVKHMSVYRQDGNVSDVTTFLYENVSDHFVPSYIARLTYGTLQGGTWGVVEKTIERRTNILVEN